MDIIDSSSAESDEFELDLIDGKVVNKGTVTIEKEYEEQESESFQVGQVQNSSINTPLSRSKVMTRSQRTQHYQTVDPLELKRIATSIMSIVKSHSKGSAY